MTDNVHLQRTYLNNKPSLKIWVENPKFERSEGLPEASNKIGNLVSMLIALACITADKITHKLIANFIVTAANRLKSTTLK